jgi:hypothetical protein
MWKGRRCSVMTPPQRYIVNLHLVSSLTRSFVVCLSVFIPVLIPCASVLAQNEYMVGGSNNIHRRIRGDEPWSQSFPLAQLSVVDSVSRRLLPYRFSAWRIAS